MILSPQERGPRLVVFAHDMHLLKVFKTKRCTWGLRGVQKKRAM